MIWRNISRLARGISNQGVIAPGPVDLQGPVQTVQVLDDASHLVPPASVPHGWVYVDVAAAGAAVSSGAVVRAQAAGVYVAGIVGHTVTASTRFFMDSTLASWTTTATLVPPFTPLFGSIVQSGNYTTAQIPASSPIVRILATAYTYCAIDRFLQPGENLVIVHGTANSANQFSIQLQEVPM